MKIVHLVAGAGGMYCGSCLHGNTLVAALRKEGRDALLLPMYTPLRTDEADQSLELIAFGGVNVYLQQRWGLFRRLPAWCDWLWDRPALLGRVARRGSNTEPSQLGELCVSMLRGPAGNQRKEIHKLTRLLQRDELRPDLVHLNNALLLGIADELRGQLGVRVVCSLTGEDAFVEKLPEPWRGEAWRLMAEQARGCDALVALSDYFACMMAERLGVERNRIDVVSPGIAMEGFPEDSDRAGVRVGAGAGTRPLRLGMVARVCPDKGVHLAADALEILNSRERRSALGGRPVELHLAGYLAPGERAYLARIERRLVEAGVAAHFCYHGEPDRQEKIDLLASLDVFCLPALLPEGKGLPVYEAWAAGVPVVLPEAGAFPEMVAATGGGLLHAPGDAQSLAEAVTRLAIDPGLAHDLGRRGQVAVQREYTARAMARRMGAIYDRVAGNPG